MNFTNPSFLFYFLPFFLILYFVSPKNTKNFILIFASGFFYFWGEGHFLLYLYAWVIINYITSRAVYRSRKHSGVYLAISILINLLVLVYYKYTNFLISNFNYLGFPDLKQQEIYLPLALSFFTFHAISYNIDTYRKTIRPEKSLSRLVLYFTFFPHLIAGPIIRYSQIHNQLNKRNITLKLFSQGIYRFITGLAKKVIIANTLAPIADEVFGIGPMHVSFEQAWLGVICFGLQIYYDFSAYTDMAIGLGLMFGFKFPENFNYPYISTSITEFWQRWHMTLSSWLKDYIYLPLVLGLGRMSVLKNRFFPPRLKLYFSLFITFSLIGLWHGANWTFVFFGVIQAAAMVLERIRNGSLINWMPKIFRHGYFLLVMSLSWVFFRSNDIPEALNFTKLLFTGTRATQVVYYSTNYFLRSDVVIALALGAILSTPVLPKTAVYFKNLIAGEPVSRQNTILIGLNLLKVTVFLFLFVLSLIYISSMTYQSFIYFHF